MYTIETRLALFFQTVQGRGIMPRTLRNFDEKYVTLMAQDYTRYDNRVQQLQRQFNGQPVSLAEIKQTALEETILIIFTKHKDHVSKETE